MIDPRLKASPPPAVPEGIRIGTMVKAPGAAEYVRQILPHGFESFAISFWQSDEGVDISALAGELGRTLRGSGAVVSALSIFGNPLGRDEQGAAARQMWERLIDAAPLFGCDLVTGFAGRVVDQPIERSIDRYVEVFGPLARRAAERRVRLAFENCQMGGDWQRGDWNIAHGPDAWELMFEALDAPNIGLQWEPCHQLVGLVDPIPQLRRWVARVFNVHGKDATIDWDVVRSRGIYGPVPFAHHRTPGFGDTDWTRVISILRQGGYTGSIDIEGWHDPVYRGDLEMTGQVHALNHLKNCRGGSFVRNPS